MNFARFHRQIKSTDAAGHDDIRQQKLNVQARP